MRFDDLNWMDIENYLKAEDRIMLVVGACEEHGYLSIMTDTKIAAALADAASKMTSVLVAPPINAGVSPYFLEYPGTISLRTSTLMDVVEDYIRSLYHHGFRKFVLVNGHGGNIPARNRVVEVSNQLPEMQARWYDWWLAHSVQQVAEKHNLKPSHANWLEAFPFTLVSDVPEEPKIPPTYQGLLNAKETRKVFGDGNYGGPYKVDQAIMDELFAASLQDILHLLEF